MDPESSQTSTLVPAIVAIVVVFQTIMLIAIAVSLAKISRSVDQLATDVRAFLAIAKRSVERVEPRIHEISRRVQNQLEQVDHVAMELLARSKTHAVAFDKLIGDLLRTANYANDEIERTAKKAMREAHAINAGVRAALGYLFPRRRPDANREDPNNRR
jgi:hypothetical protein